MSGRDHTISPKLPAEVQDFDHVHDDFQGFCGHWIQLSLHEMIILQSCISSWYDASCSRMIERSLHHLWTCASLDTGNRVQIDDRIIIDAWSTTNNETAISLNDFTRIPFAFTKLLS